MIPSRLLTGLALAATCAALPAAQDAEVIEVTATRLPQPEHTVSGALTIIDLDDWHGSPTLADVLRQVPGLHISQSGGFGQLANLRMRGTESNHVLILLDGMELNNTTDGAVNFAHLTTTGLKRIEILRGAQSALWGSHAIAGVINLVSRDSDTSSLNLQSGSDSRRLVSGHLGHINPQVGLQASIQNFQTHGDNVAARGDEEDGYRNRTFQVSTRWATASDTELHLLMRKVHTHSEYDHEEYLRGVSDAPYTSQERRTYLNFGLRHANAFHHQWNVRYMQTELQTEDAYPSDVTGHRIQLDGLGWRHFDSCLGGLSCTLGGGLEWTRERYHRNGIHPYSLISTGVVGMFKWQPWTHTYADLSLRRDYNQDYQDADTWRASLAYLWPNQPVRLYVAAGTGITDPTLTERFGYFPNGFVGNPNVIPERSRSFEFGFEYQPEKGCCSLGAHFFSQCLTDEIAGFTTVFNLPGRSRRRGVELEWGMRLSEPLSLRGSYAYVRSMQPADGGDVPEARRPRHQYQLTLDYQSTKWNMQLHASTVRGLRDAGVVLEHAEQVRFSSRYALTPKLNLTLEIDNLLDQSYEEIRYYQAPDRSIAAGLTWVFD